MRAGLTGGIGSGKSTVATSLAQRTAKVIDSDQIAREVVVPGGVAYEPLVNRFGASILQADGSLDRAALAAVVFADDSARSDLNAITHPAIGAEIESRIALLETGEQGEEAAVAAIVVVDIPLLSAATVDRYRLEVLLVVDTPEDVAVSRLVAGRGFSKTDARARMAAQISRQERRDLLQLVPAGMIIDNSGDRQALEARIDEAWALLCAHAS